MALRRPTLGYDRLHDPALGVPDSGFDSTVRIRRPNLSAPTPGLGGGEIGNESTTGVSTMPMRGIPPTPPPAQPPVAPPPAPPPTGVPNLPQTYDPQALNFEGTTYGGPPVIQPTTVPTQANAGAVLSKINEFSQFTGYDLGKRFNIRDFAADPQGYVDRVAAAANDYFSRIRGPKYGENEPDARLRQRIDDWIRDLKNLATTTQPGINQPAAIQYLGQAAYNQSVARLKEVNAVGARDDEEQLAAILASRGLSNTGVAADEIRKLHEARLQNFYQAANSLNQMLLSGEINRLTARDLAQLEADLNKRNAESLARIQGDIQLRLLREGQPSGIAQLLGTAAGTALPYLLPAAKAPGEQSQEIYGAPATTPTNPRRNTYIQPPQFNP